MSCWTLREALCRIRRTMVSKRRRFSSMKERESSPSSFQSNLIIYHWLVRVRRRWISVWSVRENDEFREKISSLILRHVLTPRAERNKLLHTRPDSFRFRRTNDGKLFVSDIHCCLAHAVVHANEPRPQQFLYRTKVGHYLPRARHHFFSALQIESFQYMLYINVSLCWKNRRTNRTISVHCRYPQKCLLLLLLLSRFFLSSRW